MSGAGLSQTLASNTQICRESQPFCSKALKFAATFSRFSKCAGDNTSGGAEIRAISHKAQGDARAHLRVLLGECERWARAYVHVMASLPGGRLDD
jgi:hypothetical protein